MIIPRLIYYAFIRREIVFITLTKVNVLTYNFL